MRKISKLEKNESAAGFLAILVVLVFIIYLVIQSGALADWLRTYFRSAGGVQVSKAELSAGQKIFFILLWGNAERETCSNPWGKFGRTG